ncbi:MAG: hypothetical protein HPY74_11440 [Firmicutes bacterium]|nr:hypothetical protein [Bacillota bacterium]
MRAKRAIGIILVILIFIMVLTPPYTFAADESKMYYESGFSPIFYSESNQDIFESIKYQLPPNTPKAITVNGSMFPFNYRLWFAKNIVVYGDSSVCNPGPNDFKPESDSPYGVGYYSKNGVRGEYRYHGFDVAGNRYSNTWFTIDTTTTSSINDNRWLYRPWDKTTHNLVNRSPYNEAAEWPVNEDNIKTKAWINRPIQKDGVTLTFENAEMPNIREASAYIHIMSPPSINYPGEGKAWHLYNNKIYYRTFTIDRLDHADKLMTDVETAVTVLTPAEKLKVLDYGTGNTQEYLNGEVEVEVLVKGILKDEAYYNDDIKKVSRYTRYDVKDWTISLGTEEKCGLKPSGPNTGEARFTLKFKRATILQQQEWPLNGKARVNFLNNNSSEKSAGNILKFTVEKVDVPIKDKEMTGVQAGLEVLAPPEVLTVMDYGQANTPEYLNGVVFVDVRITGILMDTAFYDNPQEREKRYNRDDIHSWTMTLNQESQHNIRPSSYQKNRGETIITLWFKRSDIFQQQTWHLSASAKAVFTDAKTSEGNVTGTVVFTIRQATPGQQPPPEPEPEEVEEPPPPAVIAQPDCHMPNEGFDIIPFPAYDNTDLSGVLSRTVYINGNELLSAEEFFSGTYVFGDGNDGLKRIDVTYESVDGITTSSTHWVYVYSTKPKAQFKIEGTFKENRKLAATENCNEGNVQIVLQNYPIVSYRWNFTAVDGNISSLNMRNTGSSKYKEFMYKEPGVYRIALTVTNSLGRTSDPYILDVFIYEDTLPAVELNIWNGVLTRGEELNLHYSASSVDGDYVVSKSLQLYYDSNNDGECEQLVMTFPNGEFSGFAPDKLGKYKLVATAVEDFGQDTLAEYITESDKKRKTVENEFFVDNLAPMTDIYINAPIVQSEVDLYIMMDKNLSDTKRQYITSNRINFNNTLRTKNILPRVETWDMKTYEYSQYTYASYSYGTSYPPQTVYYSSGGYSGTLNRYNVVDNGQYRDFGGYETKTESREFIRTHSNIITRLYWEGYLYSTTESNPEPSSYYINEDGYSGYIPKVSRDGPYNRQVTNYYSYKDFTKYHSNTVTDCYLIGGGLVSSTQSSPAPSSYYVNEDGYSGYIPRTGTNGPYNRQEWYSGPYWYVRQTFEAVYSGTLSKIKSQEIVETYISTYRGTLTKSVQVWVPDIRWVSDYTGYYSGTVYKYVRQPYTDPFRATSDKYVVYFSDGVINELPDLQMVMSKADAKLILVGDDSIKEQINHVHYIPKDRPIEQIMQEVLDYIAVNSPAVEKHYVIAGVDVFDIKTMNFDEENDPIVEQKFQYVQNQYYFDNPIGMESFTVTNFSQDSNWIDTRVNIFNKTGEFRIFRRIRDLPSFDSNFVNYSYYSGMPELIIYAHRKPVANAVLDWDYDATKGVYKTNWVCLSYDPDHQYSRQDKGIVERKIMFRRNFGEWYYYIPEELMPGNYELKYYVKDVEGVWSDPFTMNFTLEQAPSMQFLDAKLRSQDPEFTLDAMPASEYLEVYDAWTRYPYDVKLEMALYSGSTRVSPVKTVYYSSSIATKDGNNIWWNDISYRIPDTVKDGTYAFKIAAVDVNDPNKRAEKSFTVTVFTPIELVPRMPEKVMTGIAADISATTRKYANTVRVIVFYGTDYQRTLELSSIPGGSTKEWINIYNIPSNIPEGTYKARYIATTPCGKNETQDVEFKVEALKITGVTIEGYWNHWRGQVDIFGKQLTNEPHRFLSLERVKINVYTDGYADRIEIRFSPELEAMRYKDEYGNWYDYKEDFKLNYVYFPQVFTLDNTKKENHIYWEYVLPLAESTISWNDIRKKQPYKMEVTAWKGGKSVTYVVDDMDITGNIYDLTYIQPLN